MQIFKQQSVCISTDVKNSFERRLCFLRYWCWLYGTSVCSWHLVPDVGAEQCVNSFRPYLLRRGVPQEIMVLRLSFNDGTLFIFQRWYCVYLSTMVLCLSFNDGTAFIFQRWYCVYLSTMVLRLSFNDGTLFIFQRWYFVYLSTMVLWSFNDGTAFIFGWFLRTPPCAVSKKMSETISRSSCLSFKLIFQRWYCVYLSTRVLRLSFNEDPDWVVFTNAALCSQ